MSSKTVTVLEQSESGDAARAARRQKLAQFGAATGVVAAYADEEVGSPSPMIRKFLASQLKVEETAIKVRAFSVHHPKPAFFNKTTAKLTTSGADRHYVVIHPRPTPDSPFIDLIGLVATEIDKRIIVRKFARR